MPKGDFVGRWVSNNEWNRTRTIEIDVVHGQPVVRVIDDANGELAEIKDLHYRDDEVRFVAHWLSGQHTNYQLLRVDDRLTVRSTVSNTDYLTLDLDADGTRRWRSGILHIAPGDSAGGTLLHAVRLSGRTDQVLRFRDDLSCGPIDSKAARGNWWASMFDGLEIDLDTFWRHLTSTRDHLIIWFGRHNAQEHAFYLAMVERLGDRPYEIIDVTGSQTSVTRPGGEPGLSRPAQAVSSLSEERLAALFDTQRAMTGREREEAAQQWRALQAENAPFRVVTSSGLVSAPEDVFDELLLKQTTKNWRKIARVVGETMGNNMEPYFQVGDMMLLRRVVALVEQGKLLAHGNPWIMRSCEVKLPD